MAWLFHLIAGVDRGVLAHSPRSDRIWAAHLGFSLTLSFLVVAGVTYHATSYVIDDVLVRAGASIVVALTLCTFDRAIFQADWFDQGVLRGGAKWTAGKALKIAARLLISVGLAYTLSVFLELAIFSGSISDVIHQNYLAANGDVLRDAAKFDEEIASDNKARQADLTALRDAYASLEKGASLPLAASDPEQVLIQSRAGSLAQDRQRLQDRLVQVRAEISRHQRIMLAEELGEKFESGSSGTPGRGPKYRFAAAQVAAGQEEERRLHAELTTLTASENNMAQLMQAVSLRQAERLESFRALESDEQKALAARIEKEQAELTAVQLSRNDRVLEYQRRLMNGQDFSALRDDPVTRMSAYQQLKASPENGQAVQQFSIMLKSLIIFLEVAPVLAKLFFSPPSVYAARLRGSFEKEIFVIQRSLSQIEEKPATLDGKEAVLDDGRGEPLPVSQAPAFSLGLDIGSNDAGQKQRSRWAGARGLADLETAPIAESLSAGEDQKQAPGMSTAFIVGSAQAAAPGKAASAAPLAASNNDAASAENPLLSRPHNKDGATEPVSAGVDPASEADPATARGIPHSEKGFDVGVKPGISLLSAAFTNLPEVQDETDATAVSTNSKETRTPKKDSRSHSTDRRASFRARRLLTGNGLDPLPVQVRTLRSDSGEVTPAGRLPSMSNDAHSTIESLPTPTEPDSARGPVLGQKSRIDEALSPPADGPDPNRFQASGSSDPEHLGVLPRQTKVVVTQESDTFLFPVGTVTSR